MGKRSKRQAAVPERWSTLAIKVVGEEREELGTDFFFFRRSSAKVFSPKGFLNRQTGSLRL